MNNEIGSSLLSFPRRERVLGALPPSARSGSHPLVCARVEGPALSLAESSGASGRRGDLRWPGYLGPFEVWNGDNRMKLVNFSLRGLGIVVPSGSRSGPDRLDLELRQHRLPFARLTLEITHATPSDLGSLVGGLVRTSTPLLGGVSTPGMGDSVEVRPEGLRALILKRLGASREPATLYVATGEATPAFISVLTAEHGFIVSVKPTGENARAAVVEGPATLEAAIFGGSFSIQGRLCCRGGNQFVLDAPRVFSVGQRQHGRVLMPEHHATLDWRHPLDPSRWVTARVVDLSPRGLRVALSSDEALLLPPPSVPMLLRVESIQVPILAEARHSADPIAGTRMVGLRITPQVPSDATYIVRACQSVRFPMLVPRAEVAPASVDGLLRASGYLSLREGTDPAPGWHSPDVGEQLTVDLVYRGGTGKPLGHGSYLRLYPNTWIFHQLATIGLNRAKIAYPLYVQAAEWALALSDREAFALSYFNQDKSWHKTMLGDFLSWVGSDSLSTITSLDRFERSVGAQEEIAESSAVCVREAAGADDRRFACGIARSFLPPLVADALHISEATVVTQDLCSHHTAAGLERSRTALIVEVDGQPQGVALCETGSRALSLFNILNMAHVFFKRTMDPRHALCTQTSLLRAVQQFYEARGVSDPLVVTPQGSVVWPEAAGLSLTESMGCWVASREGIKQWKNYIHFTLGAFAERRPRPPRPAELLLES